MDFPQLLFSTLSLKSFAASARGTTVTESTPFSHSSQTTAVGNKSVLWNIIVGKAQNMG